ncbi:MAG: DUF4340 domain-containing protein [Clostridia bacterium]|nr:DUF4340 domain-containing protein [Clostridia bacterium]
MLKKQKLTIIISAILIVALAVVYFTVVAPMLKETEEKDIPELLSGETYSEAYSKIMVFPKLEQADIKEIKIHNEHGDYGFYQDNKGEFYLTDYEGTTFGKDKFTSLAATVRLPMAIDRVTEEPTDLSKYGLDPKDDPAYYIVTDKNDVSYKMFIGDPLPTSGGYYAMLEGRNVVYALDTTSKYVLMSKESYITPLLSMPTKSDDYYKIENFTLGKDGETFIAIDFMDEQERIKTASTTYYKMLVPGDYVPSSSNYDHIIKKFNALEGTEVLAFGNVKDAMTPEELKEFRLDEPKYELYYRYSGVDNYILISDKNEDGSYNAYSVMFNIVAKVDAETFDFLEWEFIDFVDKPMFQKNINDIDTVEIIGNGVHETFTIKGKDTELIVTPKSTLTALTANQLASFKRIYVKLLSLSLEDYTESESKDEWVMTFKITTRGGLEYEYSFYSYSTRRCYYTVNGEGEFYVLRDRVEKILSDTALLMSGGEVTSDPS